MHLTFLFLRVGTTIKTSFLLQQKVSEIQNGNTSIPKTPEIVATGNSFLLCLIHSTTHHYNYNHDSEAD